MLWIGGFILLLVIGAVFNDEPLTPESSSLFGNSEPLVPTGDKLLDRCNGFY